MPGNIDAALIKAEQEALRLRQQAEQEAAMAVALLLRFEQNMAAFRQYIPISPICMSTINPPVHFGFSATRMVSLIWFGSMMMSQSMAPNPISSVKR